MILPLRKVFSFLQLFSSKKDRELSRYLSSITGVRPLNIHLYKLAISHSSAANNNTSDGNRNSYERLEYLGDAVLGSVVAEYLFKKFPYKDEGFLTEIRSRIVNRESLNGVSKKIGLSSIVIFSGKGKNNYSHKSIHGDALEALVGAIFLDHGFKKCKKFVLRKIVVPHFDMDAVVNNNHNYKSMLIEWCQKESKKIRFQIIKESGSIHHKEFTAEILLNSESISQGSGHSKKKAEQAAAQKACEALGIK